METWSSYIDGLGREDGAAEILAALRPGFELELVRQPADMGRPFAVAVHRHGVRLGYMPRSDARPIAKLLDQGGHARAFVLALGHERGLARRSVKSVTLEIEVGRAEGAGWAELERPDAAEAAAAPPAARRRARIVQGRVAGALCFGMVAALALANMPQSEDGQTAVEAETAEVTAPDRAAKTQDRPTTARGIIARAEARPAVIGAAVAAPVETPLPEPPAALAEPPGTPVETLAVATIVQAPVAEPPAATLPAAVPLPIAAPRAQLTVPRPLPRPAVKPRRR
ncbi:MAG TPA: HIRAN domain-containing protein [Xanthobacteraceae bacterium]|nr:HIRAN domain-containing protein [Xanthobacteraceae bacterium]